MNGFHSMGRDISAHEIASTGGKNTANSIDGKTMVLGDHPASGREGPTSGGHMAATGTLWAAAGGGQSTFAPFMRPVHVVCAALIATVMLGAAAAPPADAGCGGVAKSYPTKRQRLGRWLPPLVVGDSVLLGAIPQVTRQGFQVDTRGCRAWDEGLGVLWRRRHVHALPHEVVMFLGADWTVSMHQIRRALSIVGHKRVLVLVTPREAGGFGGHDAGNMRRAGRRYSSRVLVLDWVRYTRNHPNWFAPDGLHLGYGGAAGLARLLRRALPYAAPGRQLPQN